MRIKGIKTYFIRFKTKQNEMKRNKTRIDESLAVRLIDR